jgi:hypothetical protein
MQDSLPAVRHTLPGRIVYLQGHVERFPIYISSPLPRLCLAQSKYRLPRKKWQEGAFSFKLYESYVGSLSCGSNRLAM